jgi:hypothetical protein
VRGMLYWRGGRKATKAVASRRGLEKSGQKAA